MKKVWTYLAVGVLSVGAGLSVAQAAAPQCSKCKMTLVTKKDATHSAPVKINGKTYYCCKACGAHQAVAKPATTPMCPICKAHRVSTRKDATHQHPMKINGKSYYSCCAPKKG